MLCGVFVCGNDLAQSGEHEFFWIDEYTSRLADYNFNIFFISLLSSGSADN